MPSTYTVTTVGNKTSVPLDTARQGTVTFAVTNTGMTALRTRGYVVTDNTASADWFTVVGEPVRDIGAGASEQFEVKVAVPADKAAGTYSFHFSVVGVENPDEYFSQGPEMSLNVTAAPVRPPVKKGYVEAAVGGLVGALAGGALGAMPGFLFIITIGKPDDLGQALGDILGGALLLVLGAFLGLWFGSAIGVWGVLRSRKYDFPGTSGLIMGVLVFFFIIVAAIINGVFNLNGILESVVSLILLVAAIAGAAVAGRALTLLIRARQV